MRIFGDRQNFVDGPGLDVLECVGGLGGEAVDGVNDWNENFLPSSGQLMNVVSLGKRQSLKNK